MKDRLISNGCANIGECIGIVRGLDDRPLFSCKAEESSNRGVTSNTGEIYCAQQGSNCTGYVEKEFSGGGQGKAPKPPTKKEGTQHRQKVEKQKQRPPPCKR